jgi:hypothetical protein
MGETDALDALGPFVYLLVKELSEGGAEILHISVPDTPKLPALGLGVAAPTERAEPISTPIARRPNPWRELPPWPWRAGGRKLVTQLT